MKKKKVATITAADVVKLRKRLGLTQGQLAERLGVHVVTVRKWEADMQTVGAAYAKLLRLMETMQQ